MGSGTICAQPGVWSPSSRFAWDLTPFCKGSDTAVAARRVSDPDKWFLTPLEGEPYPDFSRMGRVRQSWGVL